MVSISLLSVSHIFLSPAFFPIAEWPFLPLSHSCFCSIPAFFFFCQVFEVMNSYNLGCGPGGGDDALQVFEAAGLAFSDGNQLTSARKSKTRRGNGVGGRMIREEEGPEG